MIGSDDSVDDARAVAVGVRNHQPVALRWRPTVDRDVGDARRERARNAGEPLEDQVGDPVRRRAQAALAGDQALRQQLLARLHVEEFELDGEPARLWRDMADDEEIGLEQAPVLEADLRAARRSRDQVAPLERLEAPAQLQVARDDGSDVVRAAFGLAAERHDGDGTASRTPWVMSRRSCAWALVASEPASTKSQASARAGLIRVGRARAR